MKKFSNLSDRQKSELQHFFDGYKYAKIENEGCSLEEVITQVKDMYDEVNELLIKGGATAVQYYINEASGESRKAVKRKENATVSSEERQLRLKVASYVQYTELKKPLFQITPPFKGRPKIFSLLVKRGNPNFRSIVEAETVKHIAHKLIEKNGWKRYAIKRAGAQFPSALLIDICADLKKKNITISSITARRKLIETSFELPLNCLHSRRKS